MRESEAGINETSRHATAVVPGVAPAARLVRALAACGLVFSVAGGAGCNGSEPQVAAQAHVAALTQAECEFFDVNGRVRICHATGSSRKPYTILQVSERGCIDGHVAHANDYVATATDLDCHGGGCFPVGAPVDPTIPCCEGLVPDNGVCTDDDGLVDLPQRGGTGGEVFRDVCPAGQYAVGFQGNTRAYLGDQYATLIQFSLICTDGAIDSLTPPRGSLTPLDGSSFTGRCDPGHALTGQTLGQNIFVASAAGTCRPLADLAGGGVTTIGPFQDTSSEGATGGTFSDQCPPGWLVTGVYGHAGDVLDSLGFTCQQYVP